MTSSPPPSALFALSFVEFPAGISLSKLSFYGQQLMRKNRGATEWGRKTFLHLVSNWLHLFEEAKWFTSYFSFHLKVSGNLRIGKYNCFQNTDNQRHFIIFLYSKTQISYCKKTWTTISRFIRWSPLARHWSNACRTSSKSAASFPTRSRIPK